MGKLRRWFLPYAAVFQADLGSLVGSWVLRAWFVLTAVFALFTLLDHTGPHSTAPQSGGAVLAAILHPVDTTSGATYTVRELLRSYVVIWTTFVIMLTGGTISSELGVVADSILSRGISRWQYFLGKWTSRLAAVLGVFTLVMVPTTLVIWLGAEPQQIAIDGVTPAVLESDSLVPSPAFSTKPGSLTLGGLGFGLGRVAVLLAFVVTCGVALSASFGNAIISIAVSWVSIYGTGLSFAMLDIKYLSPARLLRDLPEVLRGDYVAADQWWQLGGWLLFILAVALVSGFFFSRRDV